MRYHFEKPDFYSGMCGATYTCDHPVYSRCTLYTMEGKGLAVIQQKFDPIDKSTRWSEIEPWLVDAIYISKGFKAFFDKRSGPCTNGLYPTVTVRQIMWALRMKPLPKARWESVFDRREV